MTRIAGKKVLITGAARGIGREMARRFVEEGAEVLLVDYDEAALAEAAAALGPAARAFECDLSRPAHIERLKAQVAAAEGRVDILVNNAGVVDGGRYETVDPAADERMLAVNAEAVHWMTKAFLPDLVAAPEGHLVQMASAAAFVGVPYQAVYCATKWFVAGLSEAVRQELRDQGHRHVHVTVVCPGFVDTGMFAGVRPPRLMPWLRPEALVERVIEGVKRNRRQVRTPLLVKLTPLLAAVLPGPAADAVADVLGVSHAMAHFHGRGQERRGVHP